jgi:Co/Zn/Cd efflux system component
MMSSCGKNLLTCPLQLNDVLSLIVGLWAVKVANQESNSKQYTYGVSDGSI